MIDWLSTRMAGCLSGRLDEGYVGWVKGCMIESLFDLSFPVEVEGCVFIKIVFYACVLER